MKQSVQKVRVVSNLKAVFLFNSVVKSVTSSLFCSFLFSSLLGASDMVTHTSCDLKEKFTSRIVTNSVAEADVSAVKSPATLFSIFFWGIQKNTTLRIAGTLERFQSHVGGHGSRQSNDRDLALCFISCTRYQLYSLKAVCAHRTSPSVF